MARSAQGARARARAHSAALPIEAVHVAKVARPSPARRARVHLRRLPMSSMLVAPVPVPVLRVCVRGVVVVRGRVCEVAAAARVVRVVVRRRLRLPGPAGCKRLRRCRRPLVLVVHGRGHVIEVRVRVAALVIRARVRGHRVRVPPRSANRAAPAHANTDAHIQVRCARVSRRQLPQAAGDDTRLRVPPARAQGTVVARAGARIV